MSECEQQLCSEREQQNSICIRPPIQYEVRRCKSPSNFYFLQISYAFVTPVSHLITKKTSPGGELLPPPGKIVKLRFRSESSPPSIPCEGFCENQIRKIFAMLSCVISSSESFAYRRNSYSPCERDTFRSMLELLRLSDHSTQQHGSRQSSP